MVPPNAVPMDGEYVPRQPLPPGYPAAPPPHQSPYGAQVPLPLPVLMEMNGMNFDNAHDRERMLEAAERERALISRGGATAGEAMATGPTMGENGNGERRVLSSSSRPADMDVDQQNSSPAAAGGGFTAVNQQ